MKEISPQKIMRRLSELNQELKEKNNELRKLAIQMNQKEKEYKILCASEILKKKNEGIPITIIRDVVNGMRGVAEAKLQYQVAVEIYHISREKIKDIRTGIDTLRSFLTWLREENYVQNRNF